MMSEAIYAAIRAQRGEIGTFGHGFAYSGHPVATAAALDKLEIYEERDIVGHVQAVAPAFQAPLRALGSHPLIGDAGGAGPIGALEPVSDWNR